MGWIKVDRKIQENPLWEADVFSRGQAWIDLLLLANHEDKEIFINGQYFKIKRSQHFTSIRKLSVRWKWDKDKVLRFLRQLEASGMLTRIRTHNATLLTIVNYDKYQSRRDTLCDTDTDTEPSSEPSSDTPQTRTYKNLRAKDGPSSYWSERERQLREFEEWARQGDEDEQN